MLRAHLEEHLKTEKYHENLNTRTAFLTSVHHHAED